jgi:hypothetical protein
MRCKIHCEAPPNGFVPTSKFSLFCMQLTYTTQPFIGDAESTSRSEDCAIITMVFNPMSIYLSGCVMGSRDFPVVDYRIVLTSNRGLHIRNMEPLLTGTSLPSSILHSFPVFGLLLLIGGGLGLRLLACQWFRSPFNLPPGPPRWLFGDNTRDITKEQPWTTFTAWHKQYGESFSVSESTASLRNDLFR